MIYINGRFLTQSITGVGRFALEISKALQKQSVEFTLLVPKKYKNKLGNDYGLNIRFIGSGDSHIWEQLSLAFFMLTQNDALLINFTGLGPILYKNKLMTIHDLSFLHEPKWFSKGYYYFYKYMTPIAARNSKHIITVSEFSKKEIIKYLGIAANKIQVVYNGNSFTRNTNGTVKQSKGFILGVSSLDPRKNHRLLLQAFGQLSKKIDLDLILVGKAEQHLNFNIDIKDFDASRVRFTGYISDVELQELYAQATLFIYPSLYEGFGIPPLEAIYFNCPVLIADIPVFREIFQDSAVYFNPQSKQDLEERILFCLDNLDEIRLSDIQRSVILDKYKWTNSVLKIIELLP
ncbi:MULTISPECIES: glycosyltransferase family 4 protein [unclassified Sphingobacterium]|uniref:glycosyltransferase family 4 protein n=1 Tax=unclassified Sphingobacterium TaxID=2609468 RepID=UPI0025CC3CB4|nr:MULTISPECIES: glycosyltransferase family 1 protein [unclassified Sphingobacterium]